MLEGLKMLTNKECQTKLKATIRSSGKLVFTDLTAEQLRFGNDNDAIQFATDEKNESELFIINYVFLCEETYKVCKTKEYFYVNTKELFDSLGLDYKNNRITFYLEKIAKYTKNEVYKLNARIVPRRKNKEE